MEFNIKHVRRLLKLAKHLESGKLGHKKFDFTVYNCGNPASNKGCGTNGCAIGEMPIVFPNEWRFRRKLGYEPALNGLRNPKSFSDTLASFSAKKFFSITEDEFELLFTPNYDTLRHHYTKVGSVNIRHLGEKARAKSVAKNIRKFVKAKGFSTSW